MPMPSGLRILEPTTGRGPWLPLGHGQTPPSAPAQLFGPPRYTAAEQAANPTLPMTRVVKDVLTTGVRKSGFHPDGSPILRTWTRDDLATLAEQHRLAYSRGVAMELVKAHGDLRTGIVPTDDLMACCDDLILDGDTLWMTAYVTPEQARYLTNPAVKASPGIFENWMDGEGHVYPMRMLHVCATGNPVVPGQGPFLAMVNSQSKGPKPMDFAALVEQINLILKPAGMSLPADTTEETLVRDLTVINAAVGNGEAKPAENGDGSAPAADAPPPGVGMNNQAPAWALQLFAPLQRQMVAMSNTIATLQSGKAATAQQAYTDRLVELGRAGLPAAEVARLKGLGARYGHDLSLLPATAGVIPMNNAAKPFANGAAPVVNGGPANKPTDEDCAKRAEQSFGVRAAKK